MGQCSGMTPERTALLLLGLMPDRFTRVALRHALTYLAIPFVTAFMVSSPGNANFWIVLVAVAAVVLPTAAVVAWFHLDMRRIKRERRESGRL